MQVGFSTATVIRGSDGTSYGNLEKFRLVVDGRDDHAPRTATSGG